jgi:hypothetical protein
MKKQTTSHHTLIACSLCGELLTEVHLRFVYLLIQSEVEQQVAPVLMRAHQSELCLA